MKIIKLIFLMLLSFLFTTFIFLNSFELAFERDLPYINAIRKIDLSSLKGLNLNNKLDSANFDIKKFGKPNYLKIGSDVRTPLVSALFSDNDWLGRINTGHYGSFGQKKGSQENIFIYLREDFRTIEKSDILETGMAISILTDQNWRYIFRMDDVREVGINDRIVYRDNDKAKIIIIIQDTDRKANRVLTGDFVITEKIK